MSPPERHRLSPRTSLQLVRPRHSVTEWLHLERCERAYEWTFIRPRVPSDGVPSGVRHRLNQKKEGWGTESLTSTELGTRVHSLLEENDLEGLVELETLVGKSRFDSAQVRTWLQSSSSMSEAAGSLAWKELAFELRIQGQNLVGAIDRVVRLESGRFRLIDFKVLSREKTREELLDSYRTQLELYAFALLSLEREACGEMEARLVAITPSGVTEHEVELPSAEGLTQTAIRLAQRATEIVSGRPGEPRPGKPCQHCEFISLCADGQKAWKV